MKRLLWSLVFILFIGCIYTAAFADFTLPADLVMVEQGAFMGDTSITEVTIPDSVNSIGAYAFYNCSSLESVTIPSSVTHISPHAFEGCSSNLVIYCEPDSPASVYANENGLRWYDGETLHNLGHVIIGKVFKVLSNDFVEGATVELHRGYKYFNHIPATSQSDNYEETPVSTCVSESDGLYALTIPEQDVALWGNGLSGYTIVAIKDGWETQYQTIPVNKITGEITEYHVPFAKEGDTYYVSGISRFDGSELYLEYSKYYDSWIHPAYSDITAYVRTYENGAYGTPNYGDIYPYTKVNLYYNGELLRSWYASSHGGYYWHVFRIVNGELFSINKQSDSSWYQIDNSEKSWYRMLPSWMN